MGIHSTQAFEVSEEEVNRARRLGDLPPEILSRLARDADRTEEIVTHWYSKRETYGKTLVFACSIQHADDVAAAFQLRGVTATALHSDLPHETRRDRLAGFRSGAYEIMVNVGILTEGADVPDIKTVLMARPTMSEVLYVQMIGRGARGPRTVPGKNHFFVVDCVDAFHRHGLMMASGREVAEELGATHPAPRKSPHTQRAAILSSRAWMHLNGFASQQYTLWGELRWTKADGNQKSVAVFAETLQAIELALGAVQESMTTGDWQRAEAQATSLDQLGAARTADWNEMIQDVRVTEFPPSLVAIDSAEMPVHEKELAAALAEIVTDLAVVPMCEASSACKETWEEDPQWRSVFPNWVALWQQVVNLMPVVLSNDSGATL